MDVDGDVAFFYEIYGRLHRLVLYTENTIAVGLDGVYEYRYRSVGNVVFNWCESLGMDAKITSQVDRLVSEAVAKAPCSTLRQWMTESVLSGDFMRLSEMLAWFAREDEVLRSVYPDLRFRKEMFLRLAENKKTAGLMLCADLAFNWRDKRGCSLADSIAKQFRCETSFVEGMEKDRLKETAQNLDSIRSERLDTYTVIERKDEHTLALHHRDGREFRNVIFTTSVPTNMQNRHFAAQLVTYKDKTYINGPFVGLDNLYEDLYTISEDPEEAKNADMGIYFDEPNIFDFLDWLSQEKSHSKQ